MFVYIDKTIGVYLQNNKLQQWQADIFDNLAYGIKHGTCIVRGNRESLIMLGKNNYLNKINYVGISQEVDMLTLAECVNRVFVIGLEELSTPDNVPQCIKDKIVYIHLDEKYKMLNEGCIFEACSLVCEDLNDMAFFQIMCRSYIYKYGINTYGTNFSYAQGGGERTGEVFKYKTASENKYSLCIVDSDKKYEYQKEYGQTCQRACEAYEQLKAQGFDQKCELYILACHEIENMTPLSVINEMAKERQYKLEPKVVQLLNHIKDSGDPKPLLYYDLKGGTNKIKDEQCREYWDAVINNALKSNNKGNAFPGFGNHFLQRVIEYFGNKNFICRDDYLSDEWDAVGKVLFTWGCGNKKKGFA